MDESTRRKCRTMLKQLRAYADEVGFRYLNQFTVDELTKFRATWKDGLRSGAIGTHTMASAPGICSLAWMATTRSSRGSGHRSR